MVPRLLVLWLLAGLGLLSGSVGEPVVPSRPDKKYAFVTIHYEGTPKDDEYVLGIRVLLRSIRNTGTKADIVVLLSDNVRQSTRNLFAAEGAQLRDVQNVPNPYHEKGRKKDVYQAHFIYTLNKLLLWKMEEYERVVYFDADNVVLNSIDEAFMCGHFCAVFMNPVNFHTGMLVVKPSMVVFNDMMKKLEEGIDSYDGADQGFLTQYFSEMENAPLFDKTKGVSEEPMNRLAIGYNMHHMYFYEKMSWNLYRRRGFLDLPTTIPALSLAYPITPPLKPWYWWPYVLMDNHWEFYKIRKQLDESWGFRFTWRLVLIAMAAGAIHWLPTSIPDRPFVHRLMDITYFLLHQVGSNAVGSVLGFLAAFSSALLAGKLVPRLMPAPMAWTLFLLMQALGVYIQLRLFCILCNNVGMFQHIRCMVPTLILMTFTYYMATLKVYNDPAIKVTTFVVLGAVCALLQIRMFRMAANVQNRTRAQANRRTSSAVSPQTPGRRQNSFTPVRNYENANGTY
eukprot:comp20354_c0_seq1/m.25694 comp20354_c0_seq1/g.25694  ORF comp20354_c0_seq1/g.25694 comp20354_c0_seq1/m.25694 type:complete len:509 (-) comp20354_c0_seq1:142-1668(-)